MARLEAPDPTANASEWREYASRIHACFEEGRTENRTGFRRLNIAAIASAGMFFLAVIGSGIAAVRWTDHVDSGMATISANIADLKGALGDRSERLTAIEKKIQDNQDVLVGTDRVARRGSR